MRTTDTFLFLESWSVTLTTTPLFLCLKSWNKINKSIAVLTLQLASLLYINNSVSYYFRFSFIILLRFGVHRFFKTVLELSQNSRRQKGDMKQVPYWDSTNVSRHGYLSPCFVHPCYTWYFVHNASLLLCALFLFFPFQLDHPLCIISVPYSLCVLGISFLSPLLLRSSFLFSLFRFCLLDVSLLENIWAKSLYYACFQASAAR